MRSSRAQALLANVGLSVTATALLLGLLEGAARLDDRLRRGIPLVLPDAPTSLYAPHPYVGVVLRPSTQYRDADTSGRINALGLRGPETTARKPGGVTRVVCVGGSTTFGAGIVGDENTYPARLQERLHDLRPDLRVEVLNAGVPGYTTAENVIYLGLRLLDLQPDVVVLYEGYNDFKPASHPGFASDYAHWRRRDAPPSRPPLERLRLYAKLSALAARVRPRGDEEVRDAATGRRLPRLDSVAPEGLDAFRRNLRTMIAMARSAGARTVLATYAHPCTDENMWSRPELMRYLPEFLPGLTFHGVQRAFDLYNDVVRDVARGDGAALADAAALMPQDPDLFVDHVHHNVRGADAFARIVAEAVAPLLPPASPRPQASS